jgi:hypothetical protein
VVDWISNSGKLPLGRRVLWPVGIALGVWFVLDLVTEHLPGLGGGPAYRIIAFSSYLLLGLTIGFSSLIVYPVLFFRGASPGERIAGSYAVLFVWVLKEVFRATEAFTVGESLYYAFSPVPLGFIVFQAGYMSLGEMICRWRIQKRGGQKPQVFTAGPVIGIGILVAMSYGMIFWGVPAESPGTKWFYIYQEGYKALFK